jgi:membrane-bound metal-dependent hydrolase YbcI (DUF457 family)
MPLPLGHAAIGLAAAETIQPRQEQSSRWGYFIFIALMANLPDLDILFGLVLQGNGAAYHRGPTHSLFFVLLCGYLASQAWRLRPGIPKVGFGLCSLLIFSHVAADMLLTATPVSLFWPLEIHWSHGQSGWRQIFDMVLFQSIQDAGLVIAALIYAAALRNIRMVLRGGSLFAKVMRKN